MELSWVENGGWIRWAWSRAVGVVWQPRDPDTFQILLTTSQQSCSTVTHLALKWCLVSHSNLAYANTTCMKTLLHTFVESRNGKNGHEGSNRQIAKA